MPEPWLGALCAELGAAFPAWLSQQQAPGSTEHHPSCESTTADTPDMLLFPHLLAGWANPDTFLLFFFP